MWRIRDATFTLTVPGNCPPLSINPATLPVGRYGLNYNPTLTVTSGGIAQYIYTFVAGSGALPHGMQLSSQGMLSGSPTQVGAFQFTVRALSSTGDRKSTRLNSSHG